MEKGYDSPSRRKKEVQKDRGKGEEQRSLLYLDGYPYYISIRSIRENDKRFSTNTDNIFAF